MIIHPPEIVQAIKENIYVDDIIEGGDLVDEMQTLKESIIVIFNSARFHLHKWHSNEPSLELEDTHHEEKKIRASLLLLQFLAYLGTNRLIR